MRIKWNSFRKLILVGQSHLDAAWRWRTKQGILKAKGTIKKALYHIEDPSLPYFTFSQPSPCYYQWMKDNYPHIYSRIKEAVKMGRFIPIGGSWVEMDTNIPSGESLVRQRLYGQRFYLKEFGFISDVEFLQDCFGFNQNLPQILKKSGAKIFGTGKLFWNRTAKFPLGMCLWQSPDGTKLPSIHIHFGYFLPINYGKVYPLIYLLGKEGQTLIANYQTKPEEYRNWRSRELMLETIFGYGLGDGGHGPIEAELWAVEFLRKLFPKRFKHHQRGDFYALFKKYFHRWATWNDEFYLDFHRGTYTSVSRVKRGNRTCENKIESCEKFITILKSLGVMDLEFLQSKIEEIWKIILYNQFHDILPGSSIPEVYLDYDKDYEKINKIFDQIYEKILYYVKNIINFNNQYGDPYIIFNPLSWSRNSIIEINLGNKDHGVFRNNIGKIIDSNIIKSNSTGSTGIVFANNIPPMSFDIIYFDSNLQTTNDIGRNMKIDHDNNSYILENKFYIVIIDENTGWIKEIIFKGINKNILNGLSNRVLIFEEKKHTDAWNIDPDYQNNLLIYNENEKTIKILEENPIRCTIEISRYIKNSLFIQRIGLIKDSPQISLSMDIDLKDIQWLVKLEFNTNLQTNILTSEIPYSYIDRTIKPTTKLDKARFEHACQKFVSIYDVQKDIGMTLGNNCKYGVNALLGNEDNVILRPTVVRSPKFTGYAKETIFVNRAKDNGPDSSLPRYTDIEFHKNIQYCLQIHKGDWRNNAWQLPYELNYPIESWKIIMDKNRTSSVDNIDNPSLPYSFLNINPSSVICGALKVWEDNNESNGFSTFIIRLIERKGIKSKTILEFPPNFNVSNAEVIDLLELNIDPNQPVKIMGNKIELEIKPYEIITLKIKKEALL